MSYYKKISALLMCFALCASAAAPLASRADDELLPGVSSEEAEESEDTSEDENEEEEDSAELITSGIFSYSLTKDNTACIEDCTETSPDLVIPEEIDGITVTELGNKAFGSDHDSNIYETISLPATINYIGTSNPFMYCGKLREITVDSANESYITEDGVLYTADKKMLIDYPAAKKGESLVIADSVETICVGAVMSTELKNITMPSSLTEIEHHAFNENKGLTKVDLSGTKLETIDSFAFLECTALSEVLLPETLYAMGIGVFYGCTSLTEIKLPQSMEIIGQYAFVNTGLSSVEIPSTVESIGYSAFGYSIDEDGNETPDENFIIIGEAGSMAQVYATDTDEDYGYANNFTFLTPEQFKEQEEYLSVEKFTSGDFEYAIVDSGAAITGCSALTSAITIPSEIDGHTVTEIFPAAFTNSEATSITVPDTVITIHKMAFYKCSYLEKIELPQSVQEVGDNAFDSCYYLTSADLGGAVKLGENIFYTCPSLKSLTISGNCTEIAGEEPFLEYTSLQSITVTEGSGNYSSADGVLYNKDKTVLVAYPQSRPDKSFTVPSGVTEIAMSAFYGCAFLENADLSEVKVIGNYAFENCSALKTVKLSKDLTTLGISAFYNCTSLGSLRFYDKLENLGNYSFGFRYDETADTENGEDSDVLIDGFKVYCKKDTIAYSYAQEFGIKTVTGTVELFGKNVDLTFLWVISGVVIAAILAAVGIITGKKMKKKKEEREAAERREKVAQKRREKREKEAEEKTENEE